MFPSLARLIPASIQGEVGYCLSTLRPNDNTCAHNTFDNTPTLPGTQAVCLNEAISTFWAMISTMHLQTKPGYLRVGELSDHWYYALGDMLLRSQNSIYSSMFR